MDLHEGCGRLKLFWLMALSDAPSLKSMVEFRWRAEPQHASPAGGQCRFCGGPAGSSGGPLEPAVCEEPECAGHQRAACQRLLACGHPCGGVRDEPRCLPCLRGCGGARLRQDADDMCMVCFTDPLSAAPALLLACGHLFHLHCCRRVLQARWIGPRITFGFSLCPICKVSRAPRIGRRPRRSRPRAHEYSRWRYCVPNIQKQNPHFTRPRGTVTRFFGSDYA